METVEKLGLFQLLLRHLSFTPIRYYTLKSFAEEAIAELYPQIDENKAKHFLKGLLRSKEQVKH